MIGLIWVMLMGVSVIAAGAQPMTASEIPAEIIDLCRTLKDQIVNRGADLGIDQDFFGMPRPSGGGVDIGAIECDSGSTVPPGHGLVSIRLEVTPVAPQPCQSVHWSVQGITDEGVQGQLYLRTPDGHYTLGQPVIQRTGLETSVTCAALPQPPSGVWWAMVHAIGVNGEDLGSSPEVELNFSPVVVTHPTPPAQPRVVTLPAPIPWPTLSSVPRLPPMTGGTGRLSETETWTGRGSTPPSATSQPGRLSESSTWRGDNR